MVPFPLSDLPNKLLNLIIDFLGGRDLLFGLVCTKIFRKVKESSREIVARFHHQLLTRPTQVFVQHCAGGKPGRDGGKGNTPENRGSSPSLPAKSFLGQDTYFFEASKTQKKQTDAKQREALFLTTMRIAPPIVMILQIDLRSTGQSIMKLVIVRAC